MRPSLRARVLAVVAGAALCLGPAPVGGQQAARDRKSPPAPQTPQEKKPYQPQLGQDGKNVVWVPTADAMVEQMLDMAKVGRGDYVIDLGSGDGRTVIAAARRGARAHGIEFNPDLVELSRRNAEAAGAGSLATFEKGDLFDADLSKATVVTMFLMEWINVKLRPALLGLKPGTRIVSNTFTMDDWPPDEKVQVTARCDNYCTALLWIVPARVEGSWQLSPGRLRLAQTYQKVSGTLAAWGATRALTGAELRGDRLTFSANGARYEVRIAGDTMEGTVAVGGRSQPFKATRETGKQYSAGAEAHGESAVQGDQGRRAAVEHPCARCGSRTAR